MRKNIEKMPFQLLNHKFINTSYEFLKLCLNKPKHVLVILFNLIRKSVLKFKKELLRLAEKF